MGWNYSHAQIRADGEVSDWAIAVSAIGVLNVHYLEASQRQLLGADRTSSEVSSHFRNPPIWVVPNVRLADRGRPPSGTPVRSDFDLL